MCSAGDVITIWATSDWNKVKQFKGHEDRVESVQLQLRGRGSPPAGMVVSSSRDATIKYWDINRYSCVQYRFKCYPNPTQCHVEGTSVDLTFIFPLVVAVSRHCVVMRQD